MVRKTRKKRLSARPRTFPGKALNYITPFSCSAGQLFVLICRVSTRVQDKKGNLADQKEYLSRLVSERGGVIVKIFEYVGSGFYPYWLHSAAKFAIEHRAILLAESTDRFVRHPGFNTAGWFQARARECDLKSLAYWTDNCPLMTVVPPDSDYHEVRSWQSRRGQSAKGNKGGRPRRTKPGEKKKLRLTQKPIAMQLLKEGKLSLEEIAKKLGRSKSTIQYWKEHPD